MKKITIALLIALIGCGSHDSSEPTTPLGPDSSTLTEDASFPDASDAGNDADIGADGSTPIAPDNGYTDVGCGGAEGPKCGEGKKCIVDSDCVVACNYVKRCISIPSCKAHFGGDTCGQGEVGEPFTNHESCCKPLPVVGYSNPNHAGKQVYLDKYEITAGRMRAFVNAVIASEGKPNFKNWIKNHRPYIWNDEWTQYLPSDYEGDKITIPKNLLGDPRHIGQTQEEAGPGVVLVPATDQIISTGLNHQFAGQVYADLHGGNCGTFNGSYGFPTYYYPPTVLTANGEVPRSNPVDANGKAIQAQNSLDTKSMNCATNLMFQLLCSFDGGELVSSEVMDFITDAPSDRPLSVSGCGSQYSNHGDLLGNITTTSVFTGGRCVDAYGGNANLFFDAGQALPVPGSPLNTNFYHYPDLGTSNSDKSWIVAAPGRMKDILQISSVDEGWRDIAGNLTETVLETNGGVFTGKFAIRNQGIGFGSERSDLNVSLMPGETILRVQRPEAKSGLVGSRCQYYK